ncbi:hypothetical protein AAMO2058_000917100 [Amorphochlora amoebiformis]
MEKDLEIKRRSYLKKHRDEKDRVTEDHRRQLAAIRAKIENESTSEMDKREKLLRAEKSARQDLNRKLASIKKDLESALEIEKREAKLSDLEAKRRHEELSSEAQNLVQEKVVLEAKLKVLSIKSENHAREAELEANRLRIQVKQLTMELQSQKSQIKGAEQVFGARAVKRKALAASEAREKHLKRELDMKVQKALAMIQSERTMIETNRAKRIQESHAAQEKAREIYDKHMKAMREEIESKSLSEVEKLERLLEAEREAKQKLDAELRGVQKNLHKVLMSEGEDSREVKTKKSALDAEYRRIIADLMSQIDLLRKEKGEVEALMSSSVKRYEMQENDGKRELEGLKSKVRQLEGSLAKSEIAKKRAIMVFF